ncbi:MAG TPA: D-alanyl-D-alanine carboxypeptidase family protein [Bacillota bacterium]|nr:D-alanyl-D-alanine carboxypeptidase family protein [Bacillota bacterium]
MKRRKKIKIFSLALCAVMLLSLPSAVYASPPGEEAYISQGEIALHAYADETGGAVEENALPAAQPFTLELETPSYILMEAETGRVLCEKNADMQLPPASVTKIMTLLLVMEALDSGMIKLTDMVPVSEEAASKGGSQIYLEVGEEMSVEELLKAVVIASANDASVALAEYIAGSEQAFVDRMNKRAQELGMENTHFENCTGLDDTVVNLTTARDIAIMSRELLKHKKILDYTTIWMDTVRNGTFGLTNTNRLIRFYNGANGLKTGSTAKAKFCISATALRDGMQLIAVIMAAPSRDSRNESAKKLLDYGFANYAYLTREKGSAGPIRVLGGIASQCDTSYDSFGVVVEKSAGTNLEAKIELPEAIPAPVKEGEIIGRIEYSLNGEVLGEVPIRAAESVDKISYFGVLGRLAAKFFLSGNS